MNNSYPNNVPLKETPEEQQAEGLYNPKKEDNGVTYCAREIPDYGDPRFDDFFYYSDGTCGPDGHQCPRCETDYPPENNDHIRNPYSMDNCDVDKLNDIYNALVTSNKNPDESHDNESDDDEYDPY